MVKPSALQSLRKGLKKKLVFFPHALQQMKRLDRGIMIDDVINAVDHGQIVEDYPDDPRGPCSSVFGPDLQGQAIHVLCALRHEFLAILTAYRPTGDEWSRDFRRRLK